jgi:diacylglycerol kinase (ATP)
MRRRAEALGLRGEVLLSERPGHLRELAAAAAAEHDLLVVVGGDGSLNEVVNGIAGTDAELAILPAGTGQDFGRTHGVPPRLEDAVRIALEGKTATVDVGHARFQGGDRYFANVGSVGMSGAVAKRANSMSKALGGRVTFYYALAREFLTWRNTEVTVSYDGGERRGRMHDVIVANGQWHAGGMRLAPGAEADDGLFDVVVVGDVTKLDFVTTSPKLYSGRHVEHPRIDVFRAAALTVSAEEPLPIELDGEPVGTTEVRFEVLPGALRVRVPG